MVGNFTRLCAELDTSNKHLKMAQVVSNPTAVSKRRQEARALATAVDVAATQLLNVAQVRR